MLRNNYWSRNLIGHYFIWVIIISPRNLTSFTRPFLTGRHARAGHETNDKLWPRSHLLPIGFNVCYPWTPAIYIRLCLNKLLVPRRAPVCSRQPHPGNHGYPLALSHYAVLSNTSTVNHHLTSFQGLFQKKIGKKKTGLGIQPRNRGSMVTRPFSSPEVGVWARDYW